MSVHERYALITDSVLVPDLTRFERAYVQALLDEPSDAYMELVVKLHDDGCKFPKTQAAVMMLNTPMVAQKILSERS